MHDGDGRLLRAPDWRPVTTPVDLSLTTLFEVALKALGAAYEAVFVSPTEAALTVLLRAVATVIAAGTALLRALRGV